MVLENETIIINETNIYRVLDIKYFNIPQQVSIDKSKLKQANDCILSDNLIIQGFTVIFVIVFSVTIYISPHILFILCLILLLPILYAFVIGIICNKYKAEKKFHFKIIFSTNYESYELYFDKELEAHNIYNQLKQILLDGRSNEKIVITRL